MRSRFQDHFSFTTGERNGSIVLLTLIFVLIMSRFILQQYRAGEHPITFSQQWITIMDSLEMQRRNDSNAVHSPHENYFAEESAPHSIYHKKELFAFDPNGLAEDEWIRLGLSPSQARVIKKYEAKGGKFFTKEDVKKMFVISAEKYAELEPYIVLPKKETTTTTSNPGTIPVKTPLVIELNTADTSDLKKVNGIGSVFAKRIVAYRERLGGFASTEQLKEIFGMDTIKYESLKSYVKADSTYIRKININLVQVSELKKHPYFSPSVANALVNYRKTHGNFHSVAEIRKCALVNADLYRKIAPYLTL